MSLRIASIRMKRRPLLTAMAMAPFTGVLARLTDARAQTPLVVTMVTDTQGLGDQNFNDLAKRGLDKAVSELGVEGKVIESRDAAAYVPNLTQATEQSDLTVGVGFLLTEAMTEVANQYPDDKFLLIDSVSDAPNVESVTFREQEGAFLVDLNRTFARRTDLPSLYLDQVHLNQAGHELAATAWFEAIAHGRSE